MLKLSRFATGMVAITWCSTVGIGAASAQDTVKVGEQGLEFRSADGAFRLELGGRVHLDASTVDDGLSTTDDTDVRRARLELALRFGDKWRVRLDREFTKGGGWRNAWVRYDLADNLNVKAGNFIAPFSMEDVGSSNNTMFMERSLAQALAPGFGVGVGVSYEGKQFTLSGGYFGDALDVEDNIQASKGTGFAGRATWSPLEKRNGTLHFGAGIERREFDTGDVRRVSSTPEASLGPTVVSTGDTANIDTSLSYNLEAAYSGGSFLLEGQVISTKLSRTIGQDVELNGGYAQLGWIITGERYEYADGSGTFSAPDRIRGLGAVELAARYSTLDLTDIGLTGARAQDVTAGVNWYVTRNVRLAANYVHSKVDGASLLTDQKIDVLEGRLQFNF